MEHGTREEPTAVAAFDVAPELADVPADPLAARPSDGNSGDEAA